MSKVEFRSIYQQIFPNYSGTFEELWGRLDRNKDGKLSKEEPAAVTPCVQAGSPCVPKAATLGIPVHSCDSCTPFAAL